MKGYVLQDEYARIFQSEVADKRIGNHAKEWNLAMKYTIKAYLTLQKLLEKTRKKT